MIGQRMAMYRASQRFRGTLNTLPLIPSRMSSSGLSHVDEVNMAPTMVDITGKSITTRVAIARTYVALPPELAHLLGPPAVNPASQELETKGNTNLGEILSKKGPVFATATVAGTMAVKNTSNLIPFCHPLPIESCKISFSRVDTVASPTQTKYASVNETGKIVVPSPAWTALSIDCTVKVTHKTGVEMEALTGASVTALTVYDMLKALSHDIQIIHTALVQKKGGKSDYTATPGQPDNQSSSGE